MRLARFQFQSEESSLKWYADSTRLSYQETILACITLGWEIYPLLVSPY